MQSTKALNTTLAAFFLGFLGLSVVSGQTVQNGSFENPSVNGSWSYQPAGASWNFTPWSGIVGNSSAWGSPVVPDGVQAAILQSYEGANSEISQSLGGFTVGQDYVVRFSASQRPNPGLLQNQDFDVLFDATLIGHFQPIGKAFQDFTTASFTATAGTHTLRFVAVNSAGYTVNANADNTALIDNVQVNLVPEPASVTLLAAGVRVMTVRRRRRD